MSAHTDPMDEPHKPTLLERLSAFLLREPEDREQLLTLLRSAHDNNLLDADGLAMVEGVLQVSEMQARDIMVPRAQMDVIDVNEPPDRFIPLVIETAHSPKARTMSSASCWPRICCVITPARKNSMFATCCARRCSFRNRSR